MRRSAALILALAALAAVPAPAPSAPAASKVPLSFDDYHGYTGAVAYLKAVAQAYPEICDLREIGRSNMDRPIYVLTITNKKTGTTIDAQVALTRMRGEADPPRQTPDLGKPGHWIDGGTHGNEYTGTEVCLYIVDKLVSGYGTDPAITKLVDAHALYICPTVNPDGVFNSAERELSQRGNSAKVDDDKDGRVNEDGPDDLDGDGHLTQFRYPDPKGAFVKDDQDPRLMVRLGPNETTTKPRFSVITEDRDNDGDGRRGEDGEAGFDVNRNFPEGWWTDEGFAGGTGTYPTSSPEAHALVEFAVNHRNILIVQNFHTSGGFTYRVPGTAPDSAMPAKDVAVYDLVMGRKYLEIIGEKVPEAWLAPERMAEFRAKLRGSRNRYAAERGYEMPRGWIMGYDEARDQRYGYGMVIDWWFQEFGAYAVTTELWNPARDIPDFEAVTGAAPAPAEAAAEGRGPADRLAQERALLKYQDVKYGGKLFVNWKPFKHPELGAGEIGGWIPKYRGNALPGAPLAGVCEKHWQFELFRDGLLPELVLTDVQARVLTTAEGAAETSRQGDVVTVRRSGGRGRAKIVEVTAVIENKGPLATQVSRGAQLVGNREDAVWLVGDRTKVRWLQGGVWQRLGTIDGTLRFAGLPVAAAPGQRGARGGTAPALPGGLPLGMPGQRFGPRGGGAPAAPPQTGPRREVKWLVSVEGDAPLKVVLTSEKGGTLVRDVTVK